MARKSKAVSRQNRRRDGENVRNVPEDSKTGSLLLETGRWLNDSASDPWLTNELIIVMLDQQDLWSDTWITHHEERPSIGNSSQTGKLPRGLEVEVQKDWWRMSTRWPNKMRSHLFWRSVLNEKKTDRNRHGFPTWRHWKVHAIGFICSYLLRLLHMST